MQYPMVSSLGHQYQGDESRVQKLLLKQGMFGNMHVILLGNHLSNSIELCICLVE